jgi:hypothetical protein
MKYAILFSILFFSVVAVSAQKVTTTAIFVYVTNSPTNHIMDVSITLEGSKLTVDRQVYYLTKTYQINLPGHSYQEVYTTDKGRECRIFFTSPQKTSILQVWIELEDGNRIQYSTPGA